MGTVFLSTTGAEALYSDMGHVGRGNIYFTWPFIKVAWCSTTSVRARGSSRTRTIPSTSTWRD